MRHVLAYALRCVHRGKVSSAVNQWHFDKSLLSTLTAISMVMREKAREGNRRTVREERKRGAVVEWDRHVCASAYVCVRVTRCSASAHARGPPRDAYAVTGRVTRREVQQRLSKSLKLIRQRTRSGWPRNRTKRNKSTDRVIYSHQPISHFRYPSSAHPPARFRSSRAHLARYARSHKTARAPMRNGAVE